MMAQRQLAFCLLCLWIWSTARAASRIRDCDSSNPSRIRKAASQDSVSEAAFLQDQAWQVGLQQKQWYWFCFKDLSVPQFSMFASLGELSSQEEGRQESSNKFLQTGLHMLQWKPKQGNAALTLSKQLVCSVSHAQKLLHATAEVCTQGQSALLENVLSYVGMMKSAGTLEAHQMVWRRSYDETPLTCRVSWRGQASEAQQAKVWALHTAWAIELHCSQTQIESHCPAENQADQGASVTAGRALPVNVLEAWVPDTRHARKFSVVVTVCGTVLNGDWRDRDSIQHACLGPCCADRQDSVQKVQKWLMKLVKALRTSINKGNWGEWATPMSFVGLLWSIHGILPLLMSTAFTTEEYPSAGGGGKWHGEGLIVIGWAEKPLQNRPQGSSCSLAIRFCGFCWIYSAAKKCKNLGLLGWPRCRCKNGQQISNKELLDRFFEKIVTREMFLPCKLHKHQHLANL